MKNILIPLVWLLHLPVLQLHRLLRLRSNRTGSVFPGRKGAFVLYDLKGTGTPVTNLNDARKFLPASTFKILNSLIGLETGVIPDEGLCHQWDGIHIKRNGIRNTTLKTAIKFLSCGITRNTRQVGKEKMQH